MEPGGSNSYCGRNTTPSEDAIWTLSIGFYLRRQAKANDTRPEPTRAYHTLPGPILPDPTDLQQTLPDIANLTESRKHPQAPPNPTNCKNVEGCEAILLTVMKPDGGCCDGSVPKTQGTLRIGAPHNCKAPVGSAPHTIKRPSAAPRSPAKEFSAPRFISMRYIVVTPRVKASRF